MPAATGSLPGQAEPASETVTVSAARLTVTAGRGTGPGGGSLRLSSTQPGFKLPAASHSDRDSCATPGATHRWQAAGSLGDSEALRLGPGLGLAGPAPRTRNFKSHCQAQVHLKLPACHGLAGTYYSVTVGLGLVTSRLCTSLVIVVA